MEDKTRKKQSSYLEKIYIAWKERCRTKSDSFQTWF